MKADILETSKLSGTLLRAKATNQNIFVNFKADWCLPCHMFMHSIEANEVVASLLNNKFVSVSVDIENAEQKDWNNMYKVRCIPTSYILDSNGQILSEISGHVLVKQLIFLLEPFASASSVSKAKLADNNIEFSSETMVKKAVVTPEYRKKTVLVKEHKAPRRVMNNVLISEAIPHKTITVGTFQSIDNVTHYQAQWEKESGFQFFMPMNESSMYQLNIGIFQNTLEVDEQLKWVKKNLSDYYIRKI